MSKQLKVAIYKRCIDCNYKCEQNVNDLKICLRQDIIKNIDEIFDDECKDIMKYYILWYLDDIDCKLALTKSKELSQTIDKIISEIKAMRSEMFKV